MDGDGIQQGVVFGGVGRCCCRRLPWCCCWSCILFASTPGCLGHSCQSVSMPRLPFSLPLSDHVLVVVAAAVFILIALGGKDATVTKMLIEDVLTLLLLIEDWANKQTNKLDCIHWKNTE